MRVPQSGGAENVFERIRQILGMEEPITYEMDTPPMSPERGIVQLLTVVFMVVVKITRVERRLKRRSVNRQVLKSVVGVMALFRMLLYIIPL